MSNSDKAAITRQLEDAEKEMNYLREKMTELRKQLRQPVDDYTLARTDGSPVTLYNLFGDKDDLIVVHNMGRQCPYCTLWADGFNGLYPHLEDRASFALVSFDKPAVAGEFSRSRNWGFLTLSNNDSAFAQDMGFTSDDGKPWPGVSAFRREADGTVVRTASASFGPGDSFCAAWHLFDLLADGASGWQPKFGYNR